MLLTINKNNKNTDTFVTKILALVVAVATLVYCVLSVFLCFFVFSFLGGGEGVLLYFIFCLVPLINGIAPSHRIF